MKKHKALKGVALSVLTFTGLVCVHILIGYVLSVILLVIVLMLSDVQWNPFVPIKIRRDAVRVYWALTNVPLAMTFIIIFLIIPMT